MREFTIGKNDAGQRLDRFVAKNLQTYGIMHFSDFLQR